jgi:GntR family transcriptional regulator
MLVQSINRSSKLPYYQQLYEILRGKITRGEWKPGELIPAESELMVSYQISRSTVRQVLDLLVKEGLIYRERGRGTFIAYPTLEESMMRIVSFTEDMQQRGFVPGTRVLSASLVPAQREIGERLQINEGEELARIERLRLANNIPMSIEETHLIHRFCLNVLNHDFASQSLRQILMKDYGIRLVNAKQVIHALLASESLANLLEIKPKTALLAIERVTFSQYGIPIEFLRIFYRADRYALYNELKE